MSRLFLVIHLLQKEAEKSIRRQRTSAVGNHEGTRAWREVVACECHGSGLYTGSSRSRPGCTRCGEATDRVHPASRAVSVRHVVAAGTGHARRTIVLALIRREGATRTMLIERHA